MLYAFVAAFYTTKYSSLARFLQEYHAGQTRNPVLPKAGFNQFWIVAPAPDPIRGSPE
jgi:hypothetical protein